MSPINGHLAREVPSSVLGMPQIFLCMIFFSRFHYIWIEQSTASYVAFLFPFGSKNEEFIH